MGIHMVAYIISPITVDLGLLFNFDNFQFETARRIFAIPLAILRQYDTFVWPFNDEESYSTRLGYNFILQQHKTYFASSCTVGVHPSRALK